MLYESIYQKGSLIIELGIAFLPQYFTNLGSCQVQTLAMIFPDSRGSQTMLSSVQNFHIIKNTDVMS